MIRLLIYGGLAFIAYQLIKNKNAGTITPAPSYVPKNGVLTPMNGAQTITTGTSTTDMSLVGQRIGDNVFVSANETAYDRFKRGNPSDKAYLKAKLDGCLTTGYKGYAATGSGGGFCTNSSLVGSKDYPNYFDGKSSM